jgi:hypothetical protein
LFAFFKTNNSFHGVDPITDEHVERDLLLYDIQVSNAGERKTPATAHVPASFGIRMLSKLFRTNSK